MTLQTFWTMTTEAQDKIKSDNLTQELGFYRVSGRLNVQTKMRATGTLIEQCTLAYTQWEAIRKVETELGAYYADGQEFITTWLNEDPTCDFVKVMGE